MNERIKELAEQAWDATAVSPEFGHPTSFAEKLALLIVKKCAHIAEVNQAENMGWNIGEIIKEHFGVEQ